MKMKQKQLVVALLACSLTATVGAVPLINGLGGDRGFGELAMFPNNDDSSDLLSLPFEVNFFGSTYSSFYINNNGNVSFNDSISEFTPEPFPVASQPMIAPFWSDVDTSGNFFGEFPDFIEEGGFGDGFGDGFPGGSNNVWVASPNEDTVVVTWDSVGFFPSNNSLENSFQLVLRDRSDDTGTTGDFDIEFRYEQLEWTTGGKIFGPDDLDAGTAQAGYGAGDGTNFFVLPGSGTDEILELQNTSNVSDETPGLWSFAIRNGDGPGVTADNPIMPVSVDEGWNFEFGVTLNEMVFIDPVVAIGYDYIVNSGPNVQTVMLPAIGDDLYDIYGWDGTDWSILLVSDWLAGNIYDFGVGGIDRFRVMGIETDALLDPTDPTAFVTGLSFNATGIVNMNQNPVTAYVGTTASVPAPSMLLLMSGGLVLLGLMRRRKQL